MDRLSEVRELVEKKGLSFTEAINQLAPLSQSAVQLLRRAAFVRVFDPTMFVAVLAPNATEADFETFAAQPSIEKVSENIYRMKAAAAAEQLDQWCAGGNAEIIQFSKTVYDYLRGRSDARPAEVLRFQIPHDPAGALIEFNRLFDLADKTFEIAECHSLLQMLKDLDNFDGGRRTVPLKLLSPELRSACDDLLPYVTARGRFIEEFVKSASYLERKYLRDRAENFLTGDREWVLPVFGAGGSGKTIFLRWLLSRYCIPRPRRIPVAKLDLDEINIGRLRQYPELLFLPLAEQLDRQLPSRFGDSSFVSFAQYAQLLLPPSRVPAGVNLAGLEEDLNAPYKPTANLIGEFAGKLQGLNVVLMIDTLEEASLHLPDALIAMIGALRSAHVFNPQIKVILSGRYNLSQQFLQPTDPEPVEVTLFGEPEAIDYLRRIRKLEQPDEFINAIVIKAHGNPFILSLIVDLVAADGITDVADIAKLEPEFAYLIQRVIDRIPDSQRGVRWVVRYGVVPRRLTLELLTDALGDLLREELKQKRLDNVTEYSKSFPRGGSGAFSELWSEVEKYAGPSSWLRSGNNELRFQPEVVQPMRALLLKEPIHDELHRAAAAFFAKSTDDASLAEELYHRFHLHDGQAAQAWETAIQHRAGIARRMLLEVVTGLVDEDGNPLKRRDASGKALVPMIDEALLARANMEIAKLGAGIDFGPCELEEPGKVRAALAMVVRFAPGSFAASRMLVELALRIFDREYQKALGLGNDANFTALLTTLELKEQYAFQILMARAHAGLGDEAARENYSIARTILTRSGSDYPVYRVSQEAAQAMDRMGRLKLAIEFASEAVTEAGGQEGFPSVVNDLAEMLCKSGDYQGSMRALEPIKDAPNLPAPQAFRRDRCQALVLIARSELTAAKRYVGGLKANSPLEDTQVLELTGTLSSRLWEVSTAIRQLQKAESSYRALGLLAEADRALLVLVRVLKDQKGDWQGAQILLEQASRNSSRLFLLTEYANLLRWRGRFQGAWKGDGVPDTLAAAYGRLATRTADLSDLRVILAYLASVEPPSARYECLWPFQWAEPIAGDPRILETVMRCVPPPEPEHPDFLPRALGCVEILRYIDCKKEAVELLQKAIRHGADAQPWLSQSAARLGQSLEMPVGFASDTLEFATVVLHLRALLSREETTPLETHDQVFIAQYAKFREIPVELKDTQVEAFHLINLSKLSGGVAQDQVREAVKILLVLGQDARGRRLLAENQAGEIAKPQVQENRLVISLSRLADPWDVPERQETVSFDQATLLAAPYADQAISAALPEDLADKPVVEITADDLRKSMFPWEWAFSSRDFCFRSVPNMAQRVTTPLMLKQFWPKLPLAIRRAIQSIRSMNVLILRPPVSYQEKLGRGFELVSRRPLAKIYESHSMRAREPEKLVQHDLSLAFDRELNVVHVQAPILDRRGRLLIDLPFEDDLQLDVETLSQQIRSIRDGQLALLILDPPRPRRRRSGAPAHAAQPVCVGGGRARKNPMPVGDRLVRPSADGTCCGAPDRHPGA
jgi:tetratricopeptide (TPR) repeat protein